MLAELAEIRLTDLLDISIVAALLWFAIAWLRTSHARLALMGLGALGLLYIAARGLDLQLTSWLLQGFFAVIAIMLVVVFQEDLRRLFEGIAVWGLRRGAPRPAPGVVVMLVRVCFRLAQAKVGGLIVLPGREPIERHLEGGIHLDGRVSEELLQSLFDPGSPGHDGAVVLRANRVARFGVHLPLSTDWDRLGSGGTRHAAALGLAERTDALCLVVSEERGRVSWATQGELVVARSPEELADALRQFLARTKGTGEGPRRGFRALVARAGARWREGVAAIGFAAGLWYIAVPGSALQSVTRVASVRVQNLPEGYELQSIEPSEVEVQLEGRRRDIYLTDPGEVTVQLDALLVQLGRRTFEISPDQVEHPVRLRVVGVEPGKVKLSVRKK